MDPQKITQDLLATGLTQQQLADLALCSQSTINAFAGGRRGLRPSLAIGMRLLALHQDRCTPPTACHSRRQPSTTILNTTSEHAGIVVAGAPAPASGG